MVVLFAKFKNDLWKCVGNIATGDPEYFLPKLLSWIDQTTGKDNILIIKALGLFIKQSKTKNPHIWDYLLTYLREHVQDDTDKAQISYCLAMLTKNSGDVNNLVKLTDESDDLVIETSLLAYKQHVTSEKSFQPRLVGGLR